MTSELTPADDLLVASPDDGFPEAHFDRFYFNLHGPDTNLLVMLGAGIYPGRGVIDGWAIVASGGMQRNARFSTLQDPPASVVGPLSWEIVEPLGKWSVRLGPNPTGVEIDAVFTGRFPTFAYDTLKFEDGRGGRTDFDHFVQSGRWSGRMIVDGKSIELDDWWGQRDRSRGVRLVHARHGVHLWVQPQFDDLHVSLMYDEQRDGTVALCDGAVIDENGADRIVSVSHDLDFNDDLELLGADLLIETESGRSLPLAAELPVGGGGYLAGGGYDGRHGRRQGLDHIAGERWPLDGSFNPRNLGTPIVDRLATFRSAGRSGIGIFEFGSSRSSDFVYRPTLPGAISG